MGRLEAVRVEGRYVGNEKRRKFLVAVDGEGLGKEIDRVEEGAEIRKNKHALGYPITQPIPSKVVKAWYSINNFRLQAFPKPGQKEMGAETCRNSEGVEVCRY
jgi:hypothetical protein